MTKRHRGHGEGTITERSKLPDGRWLIRWRISGTRPDGTYGRANGTTRGTLADAQRAMREARAAIEKTAVLGVNTKGMTFGELLTDWLADVQHRVRPRTHANYSHMTDKHLRPRLGHLKVRLLTAGALQKFHRELLAETDLGRTRQLLHGVISQALDHAAVLGAIDHNPARSVKVPPPPPPRRIRREEAEGQVNALTRQQADYLWRAIVEDATPHAWAVGLALALGMRRGEVYGLRVGDLDLTPRPDAEYGLLHIRQILTTSGSEDRIGAPKTRKSRRTLRMNGKARAAVDAVLAWQARQAAENPDWEPCGLLFTDPSGKPERPNRARNKFRQLQHAAHALQHADSDTPAPPLRLLSFHSLRFTFVSLAHEAGVSLEDISRVCGHASTFITELIYKQVFDKAAPFILMSETDTPEGAETRSQTAPRT